MKPNIPDIVAIMRGFRHAQERFEQLRVERIKNSDILIDGPILQGAFESAQYLNHKKPLSGLVELRRLLSKIHK